MVPGDGDRAGRVAAEGRAPSSSSTSGSAEPCRVQHARSGRSGFQAEATAYAPDGRIIKAIEPLNTYVPVGGGGQCRRRLRRGGGQPERRRRLHASRRPRSATWRRRATTRSTAGRRRTRASSTTTVWELLQDIWTLTGSMPSCRPTRRAGRTSCGRSTHGRRRWTRTTSPARRPRPRRAGPGARATRVRERPPVSAVGHAHIDSAWLWPVRETVRKVARTFSNVLALMDDDPDFVFAASSAQQYAWMQEYYPELFERVKAQVAGGPVRAGRRNVGRVGHQHARRRGDGAAVRGGEAVLHRGVRRRAARGVAARLVRLLRRAAADRRRSRARSWFLTQKISWNETNRMPHHTFWWEGIDGTRIFTHFPPVDTYNSELSGAELAQGRAPVRREGRSRPVARPVRLGRRRRRTDARDARGRGRNADLEGSPRVAIERPQRVLRSGTGRIPRPARVVGRAVPRSSTAAPTPRRRGPRGQPPQRAPAARGRAVGDHRDGDARGSSTRTTRIEAVWKTVLLQQFHDILPGSSIAWVHQEAERHYAEVARGAEELIERSMAALAGVGAARRCRSTPGRTPSTASPALGASTARARGRRRALGAQDAQTVSSSRTTCVRVAVDRRGLARLAVRPRRRIARSCPTGAVGNLLQLFRDTPEPVGRMGHRRALQA